MYKKKKVLYPQNKGFLELKLTFSLVLMFCIAFTNKGVANNNQENILELFRNVGFSNAEKLKPLYDSLHQADLNQSELEQLEIAQAWVYEVRKERDSAAAIYQNIIENEKRYKNKIVTTTAFYYLGRYYSRKKNQDSALLNYNRALIIAKQIKDWKTINTVQNELGYYQMDKGEFKEALLSFGRSYKALEVLQDSVRMASCLNNIFIAHYRLGQFEKATEALIKSVKLKEKYSHPQSYISSLINLANFYVKLEKYDQAEAKYQNAYRLAILHKYTSLEATALGNLGVVAKELNNADSAIVYYQKAYDLNDSIGDESGSAAALQNLGALFDDQNESEKSIAYSIKALKLYRKLNKPREIVICCTNLANAYVKVNKYPKAKQYLNEAQECHNNISTPELLVVVNEAMYRYYKAIGNSKQALKYHELSVQYNDSLNSVEKDKTIRDLEQKYQTDKKEQEIIILQKENILKEQHVKSQQLLTFLITIGALLLIIVGYIYYRLSKVKQKAKENELQIKNLLTEQKMLRSQMNPHFIYNSLNSIQAFISSDESYQAEKYLAQFAKLMRGILENSREDFVPLEKEIEVLDLYMELEQLRFENRFTYNVVFDDDLEVEFLSIPPMLIQPFIENAILHGFTNRTNGKIDISFAEKNNIVYCEIDDNGIGRAEASKFKKEKKHESLATKITEERLETLSTQMDIKAGFEIIDKVDDKTSEALGTKVVLKIPFIEV